MVEFAWLFVIAHLFMAIVVGAPIVLGRMSRSRAAWRRALGRSLGFVYFVLRFAVFVGPGVVAVCVYIARVMGRDEGLAGVLGALIVFLLSIGVAHEVVQTDSGAA